MSTFITDPDLIKIHGEGSVILTAAEDKVIGGLALAGIVYGTLYSLIIIPPAVREIRSFIRRSKLKRELKEMDIRIEDIQRMMEKALNA